LDEAVRRFEAVVSVSPNNVTALNNLAWLYGERRDPRAIEFGERARAADPNNPAVADTLGWLYVRSSQATKGLPLLEQAAAGLQNQGEVGYHLAVALADTGNAARAEQILGPLLADGRDFRGRADAEKRLAALRKVRL
jgi:predicted Zn-dependent protease